MPKPVDLDLESSNITEGAETVEPGEARSIGDSPRSSVTPSVSKNGVASVPACLASAAATTSAGVPFFPGPDASAWTSASFEIDNTDVNACIAARSSQWTSALTASIDGCSDEIRSPCSWSDRAIPARYPLFVRMMTFCVEHPSLTDCVSASSSFEGCP